jgi:hypothetical protein
MDFIAQSRGLSLSVCILLVFKITLSIIAPKSTQDPLICRIALVEAVHS